MLEFGDPRKVGLVRKLTKIVNIVQKSDEKQWGRAPTLSGDNKIALGSEILLCIEINEIISSVIPRITAKQYEKLDPYFSF